MTMTTEQDRPPQALRSSDAPEPASAPDSMSAQQQRPPAAPVVNSGSRQKPHKRITDSKHFADFVGRIIRAYARRVAVADIAVLADLAAARNDLDTALAVASLSLYEQGWPWAEIGPGIGMSRQGVQKMVERVLPDGAERVASARLARRGDDDGGR